MPLTRYIGVASTIVVYNSLKGGLVAAVILAALFGLIGYWAGSEWLIEASDDLTILLALFFLPPVCALVAGLALGSRLKKHAVTYEAPKWEYSPTVHDIGELTEAMKRYRGENFRVLATSNLLHFFVPALLIVAITTTPYYAEYIGIGLGLVWAFFTVIAIVIVFCFSCYAGFTSSRNAASDEFTPKLIRETAWLAKSSEKTPGVSESKIVVDEATNGPIRIYRSPRVLLRVRGLEERSYIYCWSNELRAINRIQCSLTVPDGSARVRWIWSNEDPYFVKHGERNVESYYVRFPLPPPQGHMDVKDIKPLLSNAVAIVCLEWLAVGGTKQSVESTLQALGLALPRD